MPILGGNPAVARAGGVHLYTDGGRMRSRQCAAKCAQTRRFLRRCVTALEDGGALRERDISVDEEERDVTMGADGLDG